VLKALFIRDSVPGNLQGLCLAHLKFQVQYLPKNISLLQLLNQVITVVSSSSYVSCTSPSNFNASQKVSVVSVFECWKSYSIADCMVNLKGFMDGLMPTIQNEALALSSS
jgi:hypothetical protein